MKPGPTQGTFQFTFDDAGCDEAFGELMCVALRRHPDITHAFHAKDYYTFKVVVRTRGPSVDPWTIMQDVCRRRAADVEALAEEFAAAVQE